MVTDLSAAPVPDLLHGHGLGILRHLVQVQLRDEPRPHRHRHPCLEELHRVPLPGQDDQHLHPHYAGKIKLDGFAIEFIMSVIRFKH